VLLDEKLLELFGSPDFSNTNKGHIREVLYFNRTLMNLLTSSKSMLNVMLCPCYCAKNLAGDVQNSGDM
jgi:hypothetical protein